MVSKKVLFSRMIWNEPIKATKKTTIQENKTPQDGSTNLQNRCLLIACASLVCNGQILYK